MTYQDSNIVFEPHPSHPRFVDLTKQTFGKLKVLGLVRRPQDNRPAWLCQCECGNFAKPLASELTKGRTTSCGCSRYISHNKTHGMSGTSVYHIWIGMRQRCNNPNVINYQDYGGRGITVCERWQSFENFLSDMGKPPSPNHSIERRENDGHYAPDNCYWGTDEEQSNNKRNNRILTLNGKSQSMAMWCKELHLNYSLIRTRLNIGWSDEQALTTPARTMLKSHRTP